MDVHKTLLQNTNNNSETDSKAIDYLCNHILALQSGKQLLLSGVIGINLLPNSPALAWKCIDDTKRWTNNEIDNLCRLLLKKNKLVDLPAKVFCNIKD
jgi:hypothetical protein